MVAYLCTQSLLQFSELFLKVLNVFFNANVLGFEALLNTSILDFEALLNTSVLDFEALLNASVLGFEALLNRNVLCLETLPNTHILFSYALLDAIVFVDVHCRFHNLENGGVENLKVKVKSYTLQTFLHQSLQEDLTHTVLHHSHVDSLTSQVEGVVIGLEGVVVRLEGRVDSVGICLDGKDTSGKDGLADGHLANLAEHQVRLALEGGFDCFLFHGNGSLGHVLAKLHNHFAVVAIHRHNLVLVVRNHFLLVEWYDFLFVVFASLLYCPVQPQFGSVHLHGSPVTSNFPDLDSHVPGNGGVVLDYRHVLLNLQRDVFLELLVL